MNKTLSLRFTLLIIASSFGLNVQAQNEWTLQQCIEHAFKNNLELKQANFNAQMDALSVVQAKGNFLPSINGTASHTYNFGRTIDRFTNQFATDRVLSQNFFISGNLTLFSGFQNYNTLRESKYLYQAALMDIDKSRDDMALNVAASYLQILFNEELLGIAQQQYNISGNQVERTGKLFDAGTVAKGTLLEIEAQHSSDEVNVINAENQLKLAYLSLRQMLQLDTSSVFKIVKPELDAPGDGLLDIKPAVIYNAAYSNRPEIKGAEFRILGASRTIAIARGGQSPRLTLNGSYGTGFSGASQRIASIGTSGFDTTGFTTSNELVLSPHLVTTFEDIPFSDQVEANQNKTIGLNLTIPILNGLQTRTSISRAKIQMQMAELNLLIAQDRLRKTIEQSYLDATGALAKYKAALKTVTAMEEAFKYTEQKFNVGMINSLEFNTSKSALAKSQSDLLQAKFDYIFKVKVLDFYQGKPLTF